MKIRPGLRGGSSYGPIHAYHVAFWRQPKVAPENLPEGVTQERVVWAAWEYNIEDAADLTEVLDWANDEAQKRRAIFTVYAVIEHSGHAGFVWLAGWDPTVHSGPNFTRRQPRDVDPVSGTPREVYGPRADGGDTDRPPLV